MFNNNTFTEIVNKYRENRLAHAYLIETNNLSQALEDIQKLIKILNCPETYVESCHNCNLCNLINLNNLPSIKIISPDGSSIKKDQIEDLKQTFDTIPIYSKYNVYIILEAEKMNLQSANAMLKFLEEPTPGILGFFLTSNKDIMIETIKSRCQLLSINYSTSIEEQLHISKDTYIEYLNKIKQILPLLSSPSILNNKQIILNDYPNRQDIENILKIILNIYYQNFLKATTQKYAPEIVDFYPLNEEVSIITKKMQIITKILTDMSYNVNIELILDRLILEMRGIYE